MINNQRFSLRLAGVAGIVYVVCVVFVAVLPELSSSLMGWLTHSEPIGRSVSSDGAILGLIQVLIYSYVLAQLFAWVFNKSVNR